LQRRDAANHTRESLLECGAGLHHWDFDLVVKMLTRMEFFVFGTLAFLSWLAAV